MARLPKWDMEVVPTGGGPLVVRASGDPGAAGAAAAGLGRTVAHTGATITAEARQAEERTKALQQDTQTSQYALEATQGYNQLSSELAMEQDPDARAPKWKAFQTAQRTRLGEIGDDDVRERAETWLNEQTALWDADVRKGTWRLRLKQSYDHLKALDTDATARRDDSLIVPQLSAMVQAGHMAAGDANDYLQAKRRKIRADLGKDAIAAKVFQMDHGDAVTALKDPATFKGLALDPQQVSEFRDKLHAQLDVQRAAASQEARAVEQGRERAGVQAIGAAYRGQLDPAATIEAMETGAMRPEDARTALEIATKGPAAENDGETFLAAERLVSMVRTGQLDKDTALQRLRSMAKKLKAATWESKVQDIETAGDPDDPLGRADVRMFHALIDEHYETLGTFGDWGDPQAEARYIDAKQRFTAWARGHPEATDEQLRTAYRSYVEPVTKPGLIRKAGALWGGSLRYMWGLEAADRGLEWVRGESEDSYELLDSDREPMTQQEFEDTVKTMPGGSKEQTEYYNRWVKKWR